MANQTIPFASSVHGGNPQDLIETIIRKKCYETLYWKEECFGLTAATLVDKAVELDHIGGIYGGIGRPCPFLCLLLKMLQIQPDKEIVIEFIKNEDYKYVRALGAFYMRLTGKSVDIYNYLEPLYIDYCKLKKRETSEYILVYMDEFIDELLTEETSCGIVLPHLDARYILVQQKLLEPRKSVLDEEFNTIIEIEEKENKDSLTENKDKKDEHESSLYEYQNRNSYDKYDERNNHENRGYSHRHYSRSPSSDSYSRRRRHRSSSNNSSDYHRHNNRYSRHRSRSDSRDSYSKRRQNSRDHYRSKHNTRSRSNSYDNHSHSKRH
ncbi:hypothetical protein WA158_001605 [Blastocystis sp. Blastoise]